MQVKPWQVVSVVSGGAVTLLALLWNASQQPQAEAHAARAPSDETADAPAGVSPPTPAMMLEPVFDILDCDREDMIDQGQVDEHFGQLFAPRDTNRSHTLSLGEFIAGTTGTLRARRKLAFEQADVDRDGQLTADEFIEHLRALVDAADADRNGSVTRAELIATRGPSDQPGH